MRARIYDSVTIKMDDVDEDLAIARRDYEKIKDSCGRVRDLVGKATEEIEFRFYLTIRQDTWKGQKWGKTGD